MNNTTSTDQLNEIIAGMKLAKLTGSPKQVKWAEDIRRGVIFTYIRDKKDAPLGCPVEKAYSPEAVRVAVNKFKSAPWWIDSGWSRWLENAVRDAESALYFKQFSKQKDAELFIPNEFFVGIEDAEVCEYELKKGDHIFCSKFSFYSPIDYATEMTSKCFRAISLLKKENGGAVVDIYFKGMEHVTFTDNGVIIKFNKNDWFQFWNASRTNGKKVRRWGCKDELDIQTWCLFCDVAKRINEAVGH